MKVKPIILGAATGSVVGLLMLGALVAFGLFPVLSILNFPAFLLVLPFVDSRSWLVPYAIVLQWILIGALTGAGLPVWRTPVIRRRLLLGLGVGLIGGFTLICLFGRGPKDELFSDDAVYQGVLPGQGTIIFRY